MNALECVCGARKTRIWEFTFIYTRHSHKYLFRCNSTMHMGTTHRHTHTVSHMCIRFCFCRFVFDFKLWCGRCVCVCSLRTTMVAVFIVVVVVDNCVLIIMCNKNHKFTRLVPFRCLAVLWSLHPFCFVSFRINRKCIVLMLLRVFLF